MNKAKMFKWLVKQKFRFDIAATFMIFINFFLLVVAASDNIQTYLSYINIHVGIITILVVCNILVFGGTWFLGYLLDNSYGYYHEFQDLSMSRSSHIVETLENTRLLLKEKNIKIKEADENQLRGGV